jgi:predicted Zn-dependent protease
MVNMARSAAALWALLLVAAPAPARAGVSERWYLLRGRSNMEIGNYKAAIEAYQKACELDPGSREASRSLVLAYEKNGETDRAIAQLDRYLARFQDDPEMAFKQARWLGWSRYGYRRADAIRYYRMGLARQDDPQRRLELARLLGRDRATLDDALAEWRALLAREPANRAWRAEYEKLLAWDERHRGEAIAELSKDADAAPDDFDLQLRLARLMAAEPARADGAAERYRRVLAARPADAALWLELARFLLGAKRKPAALDAYGRAVELRPGDAALRLEYARLLLGERRRRGDGVAELARVVAARPRDPALRLEYARVLLGEPGRRDEALAEFRRALDERGDRALRLEYARLLSADPARRDEARAELATLSREAPRDDEVRLAYARLLGERRETAPGAIEAYERELTARPDSAEAHAGLARAYAWEGDRDRALHHAGAALSADPAQPGLARLRADLARGREPWLGGAAAALAVQAGDGRLSGFRAGARASSDASAFARLTAEAGAATYGGEGASAAGAYAEIAAEARPGAGTRVDAAFAYDGVREGAAALGGRLALAHGDAAEGWTLAVERRARTDSATALLGGGPARGGLATENAASLALRWTLGDARVELRPRGGVVTAADAAANAFLGGSASASLPLFTTRGWELRGGSETEALHFASDRSAVAGAIRPGDGYFSPSLLASQAARLALAREVPLSWRVELSAGPAVQWVAADAGSGLHLGGDARLALWRRFGDRFWLSASARAERVGGGYQRLDGAVAAGALF